MFKINLKKYKSIWITEECYKLLRIQKKKQKKSMMMIVKELIFNKYINE